MTVREGTCAYAATRSRTTVMLIGDSHAAQWWPTLDAIATSQHLRLESLTKTTCPPNALSIFSPYLGRPYTECDAWRAQVMARIRAERPAVVVLGVARHYDQQYHFTMYGRAWLHSFTTTVRLIRSYGSRVVVLGPTPKPWTDQPTCLSGHLRRATVCATRRVTAVSASGEVAEKRTVIAAGGAYVDVAHWLCTATSCPSLVGNLLVYRDDNHLATGFTRFLAPVLAEQLDAVLRSPRP